MSATDIPTEAPVGADAGSGRAAAPAVGRWLGLAAAPTFAIMALWSARFGGHPDMLCTAMRGSSATSGMTLMYLLMGVFHSSPWLRLIASRRSTDRGSESARIDLDMEPLASFLAGRVQSSGKQQ